ncbi:MAG: YhdP family protein, partial [Nevskiales bacterium]
LPEPITGITGQVRFDNSGLTARDLRGELLGLKLALQLDPEQQGDQHLTRLQADTEVIFPRDAARLSRLAPAQMLSYLHGNSRWQADMLFDASATPARLRLSSDLKGLWVNLPPPFTKAADEALPVSVSLDPSTTAGMRADLRYGNLLRGALQLRDNKSGWVLERGHILLGEGNAQLPAQPGLWLDGRLAEFDLEPWQTLSARTATAQPSPPAAGPALLQRADLRFGRLLAAGQVFDNLRLQLTPDNGDWQLNASAPSVEGSLRWPRRSGGRITYRADLQRLSLRALQQESTDAGSGVTDEDDKTPPRDPATLPGLSLRCRSLRINEHDLGQLQIEAVAVPNGLALSTLSLNGDLEVQGSGSWTRMEGESSAQLSLSAKGRKLKQMFAALGYAPSLEADKVRLQSSLAWAPRADGIKTEALGGGFSLDLEKGVLMAVEPGAGRILGLLNFYALPRRLTLDFRDVVSEGLVFDTLKGDFRLEDGNAWTDNLRIRGPSIKKMEITGRIGLVARDYDQKVTIQPQVSSGVALAGAVAGGPAVGLALLVAQQLFKKPLENMSELSYRLRGPWDNPSIERDN